MASPAGQGGNTNNSVLMGLRRYLANQRTLESQQPNSIIARVRRRNEASLDEQIRRNAGGSQRRDASPERSEKQQQPPTQQQQQQQQQRDGSHSDSRTAKQPDQRDQSQPQQRNGHSKSDAGGLSGMLTQVPNAGSPGNNGSSSSPRHGTSPVPKPPTEPRMRNGGNGPAFVRGGRIDEAKLDELRRKPKNLSPAAALHLETLLPPPLPSNAGKVTLVLDIDETLVHASFAPNNPFDVRLTIETEDDRGYIYVAFRPLLRQFLEFVAPLFEIVIFTASQSCYADQLMNYIDPERKLGNLRLFREHCTELRNVRVKDLSLLGRPLHRVAIIDNSHVAYLFQPRNAIPIISWFDDVHDTEFDRFMPMLHELARCESVYDVLDIWNCTAF